MTKGSLCSRFPDFHISLKCLNDYSSHYFSYILDEFMVSLRAFSVLIVLVCVSFGCSKTEEGASLFDVTGEVFVDGKRLENGSITLEPADGRGGVYGEQIQNGRFELKAEAGKKKVSIFASRPSEELGPDGEPMDEQYLPKQYNTKTTLTLNVNAEGENVSEFKLKVD